MPRARGAMLIMNHALSPSFLKHQLLIFFNGFEANVAYLFDMQSQSSDAISRIFSSYKSLTKIEEYCQHIEDHRQSKMKLFVSTVIAVLAVGQIAVPVSKKKTVKLH